MKGAIRILLGIVLAPIATSLFAAGIVCLYSRAEWPGTLLSVLAICYPTIVVFGIPVFWFLKKRRWLKVPHLFSAGLLIGTVPCLLLYAVTVDPVLAFSILAGGAVGGTAFWAIAVAECKNIFERAL